MVLNGTLKAKKEKKILTLKKKQYREDRLNPFDRTNFNLVTGL